jgi:hypothetical protein
MIKYKLGKQAVTWYNPTRLMKILRSVLVRVPTNINYSSCRHETILPYTNTFKLRKMKIKIFKPKPKFEYEQLENPKPRKGLVRVLNIS